MELEETAEEITLAYVCFDYSSICFWERHLSTQVLLDHLPSLFDLQSSVQWRGILSFNQCFCIAHTK